MKKILLVILILVVMLVIATSAVASSNELPLLSELSDEECLVFLEENGIAMPSAFSDEGTWLYFARSVIIKVEEDPNMVIPYNAFAMFWCASDIKDAVNAYYGVSRISRYATGTNNILQDNTVHGTWSDEYNFFTSYAYAIDYYVPFVSDRGELMWYDPGQIWWNLNNNDPADYDFNRAANVETIADLVELDLEKLGYTVNSASTTMPNTSVDGHTKLICVRRDDDGLPAYENRSVETEEERWHDYHFMKLGADGYWYHKPTVTNPLKYNYVPTNDNIWVFESAKGDPFTYKRDPDYTYESEIWFIEYTTPHEWSYEYHDNTQHTKSCTVCGLETVENCEAGTAEYWGANKHMYYCTLCNIVLFPETCYKVYVHTDDGGENYLHQQMCEVCKHSYTPLIACTFRYTDNGNGTHTAECLVCGAAYEMECTYTCSYSGSGSTHIRECADCGYSVTEACTMVYRYAGQVNGKNTHIYECSVCKHSHLGATDCMYNSSGNCRFCGTPQGYSPINRTKKENFDA